MDVGAAFAADDQAPELGAPSKGAFDDPAVAAEAGGGLDARSGDAGADAAGPEFGAAPAAVVSLVGMELGRALAGGVRRGFRSLAARAGKALGLDPYAGISAAGGATWSR